MGGLIPLLLPSSASGRSSVDSSPTQIVRRASLSSSSSSSAPPSSSSSSLFHRRQQSLPTIRTARRGSLVPPATIPIIPFTSVEWKNAIDEVKRRYLNRKYRACSARCCEILDNLKDPSTVEPLYLIYLHFYAASSFELCARPLSYSSNYRTRLLHDALTHYGKAEDLIQNAEESIVGRTRSGSSTSSSSSLHSPGLSSVRSSISSTTLSSPRTSVCSVEDGILCKSSPRRGVKAKKKVSFSGLNDLIEFQPEPYIRPDSPTLGWEDDIFPSDSDTFPLLMEKVKPEPVPKSEPITEPIQPSEPRPEVVERSSSNPNRLSAEFNPTDDKFDFDNFLQTRSANRICTQLSALRSQVSWHRDGVEALLVVPDDTPATPSIPMDAWPVPPSPFTPPRTTRANSLPHIQSDYSPTDKLAPLTAPGLRDSFAASPTCSSPGALSRPASVASTIRSTDEALKQRIERLRAGGWQRKRFDSRRYEALREQVLVELGA
ncbi:hypothetical protein M426DRAFT_24799 [Hypoxylon sp. CI-4A]|nr:hypothetical protein M426DRAFT_24799 [Hypoxylon sp. CI-4A]